MMKEEQAGIWSVTQVATAAPLERQRLRYLRTVQQKFYSLHMPYR